MADLALKLSKLSKNKKVLLFIIGGLISLFITLLLIFLSSVLFFSLAWKRTLSLALVVFLMCVYVMPFMLTLNTLTEILFNKKNHDLTKGIPWKPILKESREMFAGFILMCFFVALFVLLT